MEAGVRFDITSITAFKLQTQLDQAMCCYPLINTITISHNFKNSF